MILHELFRVVSRFPRYISCYIAESRLSLGQLEPGTGFITVIDHFLSLKFAKALNGKMYQKSILVSKKGNLPYLIWLTFRDFNHYYSHLITDP